jgi:hypothetical protein
MLRCNKKKFKYIYINLSYKTITHFTIRSLKLKNNNNYFYEINNKKSKYYNSLILTYNYYFILFISVLVINAI